MRILAAIKATIVIVVIVVACLSLLFFNETPPVAYANGQHPCAPATPPPVSGLLSAPSTTPGILVINEVLFNPDPHSQWNCDFPQFNRWLELYNPQDQAFDLYSAHTVIDSGSNTNSYYLPLGSAIAAHNFLTLFPEMNAQFNLTESSMLRLLINGVVIDEIAFPALDLDTSYARMPDGDANWQPNVTPTINISNLLAQTTPMPSPASSATVSYTPGATATTKPHSSSPTPRSRRSSGGGTTGTTPSRDSNQQPFINGTSPTWDQLHHPETVSSPTPTFLPTPSAVPPPSMPDQSDNTLWRKILMTILAAALACTLLWCWRLFKSP